MWVSVPADRLSVSGPFLRHGVDLDLRAAVATVETEVEVDVRATYVVLMTSPLCNPNSIESTKQIQRLRTLGHAIGLHYDPTVPLVDSLEAHIDIIRTYAPALAVISEGPVESFSAHRPATHGITLPDDTAGIVNAYTPAFPTHIHYCSDSGGC